MRRLASQFGLFREYGHSRFLYWLGAWDPLPSLPFPQFRSSVAKVGQYVVTAGGFSGGSSGPEILYSVIDNNGLTGGWSWSNSYLPILNCCAPMVVWGNRAYIIGGHDGRSYFSSVLTTTIGEATPTPTPVPTDKIVLVPGFGGSWNRDALFNCKVSDYEGEWSALPYVDEIVYGPLSSQLTEGGWTVYPYYYDWRQDVRVTAENMRAWLAGWMDAQEKVNLVGHSLGGLVGRSYLESEGENNKLEKMMTVGTPHMGVVAAYPAWSGGEVWLDSLTVKIASTLAFKRCHKTYGKSYQAVREVFPSVKNILPTFDYLRPKFSPDFIPAGSMVVQNNWLPTSFDWPFWGVELGTLSGEGYKTIRSFSVQEPNKNEDALGKWEDGKTVGKDYTSDGDGAVLVDSGRLEGADNRVIFQDHIGLMSSSEGVSQILDFLGSGGGEVGILASELESALVFATDADLMVIDPVGKARKAQEGLVIFWNPSAGKYKLKIGPKTNGEVEMGRFLPDGSYSWIEVGEGEVEWRD